MLNNEAALLAQQTIFLQEMAELHKEMAALDKEMIGVRRGFAEELVEFRKELEMIKAVLLRHEAILEKMPDAIREKIGFKQ